MDDPETEMLSSKHYELKGMTSLLNTGKHLTFAHLNISSLPFHFVIGCIYRHSTF